MMDKQQRMSRLTFSAISISALLALLALSACSSDNTDVEAPTAVSETTTDTAVVEMPTAEPEVVTPEPVAEVESAESTVAIEESPQEVTSEPEVLAADAGAKLYESNCKVCHDAGLLNAPKYGDQAAWAARLSQGKDTLHMHSAKGFNKMPAQVTDDVSEAQVYAAVDYMIEAVS